MTAPKKFSHPLFLGRLVVRHKDCWASEFTRKLKFLLMDIFIYQFYENEIDVYAIIKPKTGKFFSVDQIKKIYNEINLNPFILITEDDVITNVMLVLRLRIRDLGGTKFVIRTIKLFSLTPFEIGLHVEDGKEYLYSLFSSTEDFEGCKRSLRTTYGETFEENLSILASSPGLQEELNPPLFGETILCNIGRFEEYRKLLNEWMVEGTEFASEDWNWKVLEYINQIVEKLQIDPRILDEERSKKPPETIGEKLKRLVKEVTEQTCIQVLAYWLKVTVRFTIMHYSGGKIDIGDP